MSKGMTLLKKEDISEGDFVILTVQITSIEEFEYDGTIVAMDDEFVTIETDASINGGGDLREVDIKIDKIVGIERY